MSALSDVEALYGSVRNTWAKSQAHVTAHLVLAGVVFGICGATIPRVSLPQLDPKQISGSEWFKLAKETGTIYLFPIIPIVILGAYGALLRTGGQLLVTLTTLVLPPTARRTRFRLLNPWVLEPLALTVGRTDFHLTDLEMKSRELALKYRARKNEQWDTFQQSVNQLTKNAQVYLGDFLLFLLFWFAVFRVLPEASWIQANKARFWPVTLTVSALAIFAWFRVSRAMSVVPGMFMLSVSTMLRVDPDAKPLVDVSEEARESVREKLEQLLREENERGVSRPSLVGFLRDKAGLRRRAGADEHGRLDRGWPFPSLYERGFRFSWDEELHGRYDTRWLPEYLAYLYFRLYRRVSTLLRSLWQLVRYIITGAP